MPDLPTTKPELEALRSDLIQRIQRQTLTTKERMDLQLTLSEVNASIKHHNMVAAADAKRDADMRKALGRKEAEANAARHNALANRPSVEADEDVLGRAKALARELSRYPEPKPAHIIAMADPLGEFIQLQMTHMAGQQQAQSERSEWESTWTKPEV